MASQQRSLLTRKKCQYIGGGNGLALHKGQQTVSSGQEDIGSATENLQGAQAPACLWVEENPFVSTTYKARKVKPWQGRP